MSEMNTSKAVFCDVWPNLCSTPCYLCVLSIRDYCDVWQVHLFNQCAFLSHEISNRHYTAAVNAIGI